ncbi:disease resistance protein Pik-2-like isoform X2 [Phragmites australis]|uniref:disease resistance protein Pik-2-like isoform X2 n=1 Tax=Phragmites australis TaxID=29695 RepID=UPI002D77A8FF|nr:disease resistance protein Pik-2-like isoform X2 [Phragmites australis]XP_062197573.1 disease resistance protein Pik-2-like isoform X2 [Phragmites australis]
MDLVTGAMGSLAPKLLQLLQDEYKLHNCVKEEVKSLSKELESIHVFLRKVAEVPWDQLDEQVKVWAREVREASYDMEDVLDTFLVRVEGRDPADPSKLKRFMKKMRNLFSKVKGHHEIAGAIEGIKKQLQEVAERRARYKVDEIVAKTAATTSTIDPRLEAMYKEATQLVGIDKSRGEIISMLTSSQGDDASNKKIMKKVSIVGVGGLGKTTLAKASYDKLKSHYDCGAFVSVGRNPDLVKVFKDILFYLDKHEYKDIHNTGRGIDLLIHELREFLEKKRYFIVIDDIWEPQSWEKIKLALVENNCGSRIITTTRKFEVAKEAGEVYKLQPLSYDNSKKLFYTRIFGEEKSHDNQPDEVCDKILKKCDGIPLAIITMASLLVGNPKEEWSNLYSAIGFGHKDSRHVENTIQILSFSYYDLPSHLRTCLLYLSAYPEDYVIEKDPLISKWIAEGFVHEKQGKRLFEVGEGYFNDLINRSMIQAMESERNGIVYGCCVHDMVLDLIRDLSYEENFVAILDNVEGTISKGNVRRLAHQNSIAEHITPQANDMDMPQVRSYIVFRCDINQHVPLSSFKLLRVLAIEDCKGVRLENLGNLLHLRYLGLRRTNISEIPKQIENLKFLQTLDVTDTGIRELPASFFKLTQLMCLCSASKGMRVPDGFGQLTSLEELRIILPGTDDKSKMERFVKDLGSLKQLRVLQTRFDVMDDSLQKDLVESLCNLHKIQHLSLFFEEFIDAVEATWEAPGFVLPKDLRHLNLFNIKFPRLPSCINLSCLPNLSFLRLEVKTMDEQVLEKLGRLPELRYLSLHTDSVVTISNINAGDRFFQKLRWFRMPFAMVQFQGNEDSSVSFHIWNGNGVVPFGSRKNDRSSLPVAVMPNLQVLQIAVLLECLDGNFDCGNIGLEYLHSLKRVKVCIYCRGASDAKVNEAQAALQNEIEAHRNCPVLDLRLDQVEYIRRRTAEGR